LALAAHNFHDTNGVLPPFAAILGGGNQVGSSHYFLLPFIEQDNIFKQGNGISSTSGRSR